MTRVYARLYARWMGIATELFGVKWGLPVDLDISLPTSYAAARFCTHHLHFSPTLSPKGYILHARSTKHPQRTCVKNQIGRLPFRLGPTN